MKLWTKTILLALCAGGTMLAQDIRFNFDPNADFSKYKTYKWAQHPDSQQVDQLTLKNLAEAFDGELAKKGLQKVTGDSPADLVIVYQIGTGQEKQVTSFSNDFGYGPGWRGGWYGGMGSSTTTSTTSTIHTGQVVLDMYDTSNKQLVWRGLVSKTLDPKAKQDKQKKNMAKAAAKLMKKYPPPKKG